MVCLLEVDFSPGWTHFGPLLGAKTLQSMTISGSAPNSILWLWDLPKNQAYLAILMDFINFLPLVVVFAHLAHFGGQQSPFKRPDQFVGAPWRPLKVLNPLRYAHHSCKIPAPPKIWICLKNEAPHCFGQKKWKSKADSHEKVQILKKRRFLRTMGLKKMESPLNLQ